MTHRQVRITMYVAAVLFALPLATAIAAPSGTVLYAVKVRAVEHDTPPLYDLRLIRYPSRTSTDLFAKIPDAERPQGVIRDAKLLNRGSSVLFVLDKFRWSTEDRGGLKWCELWQLDIPTGKLKRLLNDVELPPILHSPDRSRACIGPDLSIWSSSGLIELKAPEGYSYSRGYSTELQRWPLGSPGPVLLYGKKGSYSRRAIDIETGKPVSSWSPETHEAAAGRKLVVRQGKNRLTLSIEGIRPGTIASVDTTDYGNYESAGATLSPDGRYAVWFANWWISGAITNCYEACFLYNLSGNKPAKLKQIDDVDPGWFIGWSRATAGFYFFSANKVRLMKLPRVADEPMLQLPPRAVFLDLVEDAE